MLNISRENAIKLISDIRKVNEKEIDFKKYTKDSSSINNMVQTELYTEIKELVMVFYLKYFVWLQVKTSKFTEMLKDYLFVHAVD